MPAESMVSRSRNSRSRVSSAWVRMPSAMEWATPCFQPSSRASLTVAPSLWERRAISARVSRRVFSSKLWVLAASAAMVTIWVQPDLEGLLAVPVGAGDDAGLLAAVSAGAGGGVKQVGEGHSLTLLLSRIVLLQRES